MPKEITFYVFLGEKRDPSKIYANSNLRNLTHIAQKPSYVYLLIAPELLQIPAKRIWPESCFFVFASIRVPMYRTYVL
jgi:hypothetical protein